MSVRTGTAEVGRRGDTDREPVGERALWVFVLGDALTGRAARLLLGAVASAALFVVLKSTEYALELRPGRLLPIGDFAALYLTVTGLHLLHVLIGSVLLLRWRRLATGGEPWSRVSRFAGGAAVYWHMVDLLWVVILTLVYLAVRAG